MLQLRPQPTVLKIWRVFLVAAFCIPAFVLSLVLEVGGLPWLLSTGGWLLAFFILYLFYLPAFFHSHRYSLEGGKLILRRGVIYHNVYSLEVGRVQFSTLVINPLDRLFGLASLRVVAAGGDLYLPGLKRADALLLSGILAKEQEESAAL